MSLGGHVALNASETEELGNVLAAFNIADGDNRSDVSMEQMIADEIVSIASSAAAMERQALEQRVVELETQLLRASAQRTAARAATAAELRNQAIHDRSLSATAGIATVITTLTPCGGCLSGSNGAKPASLRTATLQMRRISVRIRIGYATLVRGWRRGWMVAPSLKPLSN